MKFKKLGKDYIIRLERGEDIYESMRVFAAQEGVKLAQVSGIGAVDKATVGLYDVEKKEYYSTTLEGEMEVLHLAGNISTMNGEPYIHLHITLGDEEFKALGGHLNYARISATCEIIIQVLEGVVDRYFDEEIGLNFFKLD